MKQTQLEVRPQRLVISLHPRYDKDHKEYALVKIVGPFSQIKETLEQLAWLAATLRPQMGDEIVVSDIDFRAQQIQHDNSVQTVFRLSLFDKDQAPQVDSNEPGQCWTTLFTQSVLAYGFPLHNPDRPEGILGLEIPFQIMAEFADTRLPIMVGDRVVFASDVRLLVPQMMFGTSIQWHVLSGNDRFRGAEQSQKILDPKLQTLGLEELMAARAFLGYCSNSEILLGTEEFKDRNITSSEVPYTGPKFSFKREGPIGAVLLR